MQVLLENYVSDAPTLLSDVSRTEIIDQSVHPWRQCDITLPADTTRVCYMIVSVTHPDVTYIGETSNLCAHINQHNSRSGSLKTSSEELQPWALVAYVAGFGGDVSKRRSFETVWQHKLARLGRNLDLTSKADLAADVIAERRRTFSAETLRYVKIGLNHTQINNM